MIKLIPAVKHMETYSNFFSGQGICYEENNIDSRLLSAMKKLPYYKAGAKLDICIAVTRERGTSFTSTKTIYVSKQTVLLVHFTQYKPYDKFSKVQKSPAFT